MGLASWTAMQSVGTDDSFNQGRLKWNADSAQLATRTEDLYTSILTKLDEVKFQFGTDGDYSLRYSTSSDVFILNAEAVKTAGNLFRIDNNDSQKFAVGFDGVLKLTTIVSATPIVGGFYFSGTDLYLGR